MFNEAKSTQAAARIVASAGGVMNYMLLLKFLYLADRQALLMSGMSITGDEYYTLKNGPILSVTMELITKPQNFIGNHPWLETFETHGYDLKLLKNPGDSELSQFEEEVIDGVFEEFKRFLAGNVFALPDWMHINLPEVKTIQSGRIPLELIEILQADHKSNEEIEMILSYIKSINLASAFSH